MSCVKCFVIVHKCSNKINAFNVNKQYFDRGVLFLFLFWFRFSVVRFFFRNLTLDYQIGALVVFFFYYCCYHFEIHVDFNSKEMFLSNGKNILCKICNQYAQFVLSENKPNFIHHKI